MAKTSPNRRDAASRPLQAGDDDRFRRAHQQRLVIATAEGPVEIDLTESPLRWLASRRDARGRAFLDRQEVEAGERFRRDFTLAGLSPRLGARWDSPVAGGRGAGGLDYSDLMVAAKQRLGRAADAVGPELSSLLMDVCGFLKGLEEVERARDWPARTAKVVLKLALAGLARHYGIAPATGPARSRGIRGWRAASEAPPA